MLGTGQRAAHGARQAACGAWWVVRGRRRAASGERWAAVGLPFAVLQAGAAQTLVALPRKLAGGRHQSSFQFCTPHALINCATYVKPKLEPAPWEVVAPCLLPLDWDVLYKAPTNNTKPQDTIQKHKILDKTLKQTCKTQKY